MSQLQAMPHALPRALMLMGMIALVTGVLAGLARLAVGVPPFAASQAGHHGALMIAGFLGTVIALERAAALAGGGLRWPFLGPLAAGLGGLFLLVDLPLAVVHALFALAGLILTIGSTLLFFRQPAAHLATLALGAAAWLGGTLVWWIHGSLPDAVPWWIDFLLLTIAGERLELTRFLPTSRTARRLFVVTVAMLLSGPLLVLWHEQAGSRLLAAGCIALALWLMRQDIARHTVKHRGLPAIGLRLARHRGIARPRRRLRAGQRVAGCGAARHLCGLRHGHDLWSRTDHLPRRGKAQDSLPSGVVPAARAAASELARAHGRRPPRMAEPGAHRRDRQCTDAAAVRPDRARSGTKLGTPLTTGFACRPALK